MKTPDHPVVHVIEHYVARLICALPAPVLRIISRDVARPEGVAPAPEVGALLTMMAMTGERALGTGDDPEARRASTRHGAATAAPRKKGPVRAQQVTVAGAAGDLAARLYIPQVDTHGRLLVFYHGGGWVTGDLDTHDSVCRLLAVQSATRVVSVDYRLAPEHPFPAPADDAIAAFAHVVDHAAKFGARPDRIAVGGRQRRRQPRRRRLPADRRRPAAGGGAAHLPGVRLPGRHRLAQPVRRGLPARAARHGLVPGPLPARRGGHRGPVDLARLR